MKGFDDRFVRSNFLAFVHLIDSMRKKKKFFTIIYFKGINKLFRFFQSIVRVQIPLTEKTLTGL